MTPTPTPSPSLEAISSDNSSNEALFTFWASVIDSLAWPLAVFILLLIFKSQVKKIADRFAERIEHLRSFKGPGVEAEWNDQKVETLTEKITETKLTEPRADMATEETNGAPPPPPPPSDTDNRYSEADSGATDLLFPVDFRDPLDDFREIAIELARTHPSAGVIASFIELEREVGSLLDVHQVEWRGSPISALRRTKNIPVDLKNFILELSELRNAAAHGKKDISLESATNYIEATIELAKTIRVRTSRARNTATQSTPVENIDPTPSPESRTPVAK